MYKIEKLLVFFRPYLRLFFMTNISDRSSEGLQPLKPVVAKFGGTSMAQPEQVLGVIEGYVPEGSVVIPSAPGAMDDQPKVTDLLEQVAQGHREFIGEATLRMSDYADRLGLLASGRHIDNFRENISESTMRDYILSRGEHYTGLMLAQTLDVPFIKGDSFLGFERNGRVDRPWTREAIQGIFPNIGSSAVAGAYYGISRFSGGIKTFSRGGSDRTGAILAATLERPYYNWTDKDGVSSADPDQVKGIVPIRQITRSEMREMAVGGAVIIHPEALVDLNGSEVTTYIRDTFDLAQPGTEVVLSRQSSAGETVIGLAFRDDIVMVSFTKIGMNEAEGYESRLASLFAAHGVSLEITNTSVDTLSFGFHTKEIKDPEEVLEKVIKEASANSSSRPDRIKVENFAAIYIVGQSLRLQPQIHSAVTLATRQALAEAGIFSKEFGAHDGDSVGLLVPPPVMDRAVQLVHDTLITATA